MVCLGLIYRGVVEGGRGRGEGGVAVALCPSAGTKAHSAEYLNIIKMYTSRTPANSMGHILTAYSHRGGESPNTSNVARGYCRLEFSKPR